MGSKTLDLRKVFGMIVTYNDDQPLVSPNTPFDVMTELYPGGESAIHVHPHQDEVYEVKEGVIEVYLDGRWKQLHAGGSITIPRGVVHAFRNKGREKVVAFNRHAPGLQFGEMLVTIRQYIDQRKITGTKGFRNLAHISSIMVRYSDVMTPVKPTARVVKAVARIGRLFGYS